MARRTKEEAEETRENVLYAALDVFAEKGYSRTTFVDIAKRIGMTKGAVYWHFKDKQSLLAALIQEIHDREHAVIAEKTGEATTLDGLKAYLVTRVRIVTEDEFYRKFAFFMLMQMEWSVDVIAAVRDKLMSVRTEPFEDFDQILTEVRRRGELREDLDIKIVKHMLKGMWLGLLNVHFQGIPATDPVHTAKVAFEALIESLKA